MRYTRRRLLGLAGSAAVLGSVGAASARPDSARGRIRKLGHSLLSNPPGGYAEEDLRDDGRFAVLGSFLGEGGSFLVDVDNPTNPTEVHRLPSSGAVRNADVAFDPRDGLYYRSQEGDETDPTFHGVEVVDYGFAAGSPTAPQVVGTIDSGPTHNVFPHPEVPLLYAVNDETGTPGMEVWDVADPTNPSFVREAGPQGALHDVVVDPGRDLMHAAYIVAGPGGFEGYAILDASTPADPQLVGSFDYAAAPDYTTLGEEGFELCHYADFDPGRGLAYVGDEIAVGVPGGKHVFDVGFDQGSVSNPVPVGFTISPNAQVMGSTLEEIFDWTTHNHDVVTKGATTLLVSGDYHEGTVVYDVTEPTDPTPADRYATDDGATPAVNDDPIFDLGEAPMAWGANYSARRDLVVTSDFFTGVYTFKVTPSVSSGGGGGP